MDLNAFRQQQRNKKEWSAIKREFKLGTLILGGVIAFMGLVLWADGAFGLNLVTWGIEPRSINGLPAIIYGHFIHLSFAHYAINMVMFAILGGLVLLRDVRDFAAISVITMLVSGASIWLLGGDITRVGSGLLICGYLGYLLVYGFLEKSVASIIVTAGVALVFFSTAMGAVSPFTTGSWIGCTTALLTGAVVGRFMVRNFKSHLTNSVSD